MNQPSLSLWQRIANFFESGDLVPFAVVVSSFHFVTALVVYGGEAWPVAVLVGIFVDMLHYRTIRYAVRGQRTRAAVALAVLTTAMSYVFHLLFYIDGGEFKLVYLLLAAPLPLGIFILAWQQEQARAIDDTASRLQAAERRAQELETAVQELETRVKQGQSERKELERQRKEAERQLQAAAAPLQGVNPIAQDVIMMLAGHEITQADIARRHGVSEAKVSRVKASLNGVEVNHAA